MQGLRRDVIAGRVNLILCTELSRLSRSLHAFLDFYEFLKEHDTALVCLKQNIDSTSAQGLLMTQITVALAKFERGQTCERKRDTTLARCERGLWNGGAPLLGYDLPKPSELRGTLLVNEADAEIVRLAFSIYERTGSICETGKELNAKGFRTKPYRSRRGREHSALPWCYTRTRTLLQNKAYIGVREINKRRREHANSDMAPHLRYREVKANWSAIIDRDVFERVQRLLAENKTSGHSAAKEVRHVYI